MCTSPLDGWFSRERTQRGKREVVFKLSMGFHDRPVTVPCGRCMECRLRKKREWALRCQHEASLHDSNSWLTLTYDNENLPRSGELNVPTLRKSDLSAFLKRLRARDNGGSFKFFACGEYGGRFNRPHYHVLLFGYDFLDKVPAAERNGYRSWNSPLLDAVWKKGLTEIGEVGFDGMAYLAKYVTKKDAWIEDQFRSVDLEPEFIHMSRGGKRGRGIGYDWWRAFGRELLDNDSVILKGQEVAVPRYYDRLNEVHEPEEVKSIKARRAARCDSDASRSSRLLSRQKIVESGVSLYK